MADRPGVTEAMPAASGLDTRGGPELLVGGGETGELMRAHDWRGSPLGVPAAWPQPLKTLVGIMLGSNQPMFVAWGRERTLLYNEPYSEILADKHPAAMGRDFLEVWHELQGDLLPIVERTYAGEPVHMADIELIMQRKGYPEETHFSFFYAPVRDEAGEVRGLYCACNEITQQVLTERRRRDTEADLRAERDRTRRVLDGMEEGFALLDREFRVIDINAEGLRLEGREREDIVGRTHWEAWPGSGESELGELLKAAMAERRPIRLEHRFDWEDGRETWLETRAYPIDDGLALFWNDVTVRRRAEAEVRATAERNVEILESISDAFYAVDRDWRFTYVNRRAEEWLGRSRKALIGQIYWDEFPEIVGSEPYHAHLSAAGSREVVRLEALSPILDHWIDMSIYPTADGGLSVYFRDIGEKRQAEQRLRESEARFRQMADAVPQIVWITDPEGRNEFFNRQWSAYTGAPYQPSTAAEVTAEHIHPEDQEATIRAFERARDTGTTFHVEHRIRSSEGDYRWFLARGEPYREEASGKIVRWFGASADIHDRKLAEAALQELNATLAAQVAARAAERDRLWNLSQDMLARADYSGMMSAVSPAWTRVLGWTEGELLKRPYASFMHSDDMPGTLEAIGRMAETRQPALFENRIATRDGDWKPIEWTVAPDPDGVNFIAVGRDLSHNKAREAELAAAQEALRQSQKMEAMGSLTGGVAHDFNNLLTPIIGSLDMLVRKGIGSERERRLIDGALQSAERAKVLVQRLLAFARRQPLQATAVDPARVVEGMAGLIESTVGPAIAVRLDVASDLPPARADLNQLEMALLNLAVNARDAMPGGGELMIAATRQEVRPQHVSCLAPGEYIRLSVSDTGVGMDEETRRRAIEPFFSTKGIGKGTGLGLSMVHGLTAQLGGGLIVESSPGEGTTVALWLPLSANPVGSAEDASIAPQRPIGRGTALLVDDEELVRMSTAEMLIDLGFQVVEAGSAEEALRILQAGGAPDLLVTDHLMPGMSGAELARKAREHSPALPILVISGYAEVDGIAPDLPRLTKPFRNADLAASLSGLLPFGAAP